MSEFTEWFEAQHGKRPGSPKITDAKLREQEYDGLRAEAMLRRREEWDARFESALYAWQARGPKPR